MVARKKSRRWYSISDEKEQRRYFKSDSSSRNSFCIPEKDSKVLLIGGGVGVAPMLYWGAQLKNSGIKPEFLLGARSDKDLLELHEFESIGEVHISTEDGSLGERGLVTANSVLSRKWDIIYCCGPAPMMKCSCKSRCRYWSAM